MGVCMGSIPRDTGGEFTGPAGRSPVASVAGPNFPVDAGWADRLAHKQTDNSEFATSVGGFRVHTDRNRNDKPPTYSLVGKPPASSVQGAREAQCTWADGRCPGSASRPPQGTITSRPLRVVCGSCDPQVRQKATEKLCAVGRS